MSKRKRPANSPKRSRANAKRVKEQSAPKESTDAVATKQLNPLTVALILTPLLALLAYGGYQLFQAGQSSDNDPITQNNRSTETESVNELEPQKIKRTTAPQTVCWENDSTLSEEWDRIDNPAGDGWDTEVFNNRVGQQLTSIKKKLADPNKLTAESLSSLVTREVAVGVLRPEDPASVWKDEQFEVFRANSDVASKTTSGPAAMASALQSLANRFNDPNLLRAKMKVFRIKEGEGFTDTWQTVEFFGETSRGIEEENMIWKARWELDESGRFPLIASVDYESYEGVVRPGNTLFSDCTESIFEGQDRFNNQLLVGYNQILQRCQVNDYYLTLGNPGLALGDVNNDGLDDLFLCQENGVPNALFLRQPNGTLIDATTSSGLDWLQNCRTALIVDLDNDGNNDVAVAYTGGVVVASGNGRGQFKIQTYLSTSADVLSLNAADYDLDGRLDLFVGVYGADDALLQEEELTAAGAGGAGFVYVDAKDGGRNSLFQNQCVDGNWEFLDVTKSIGLNQDNQRYSQAASWADFDNDGDPDLYIANDYGPNNLFRNDVSDDGIRQFIDISKEAGTQDSASGMSVDWADFDRNGWQDIYVGNMYSYAGNRIAFQNQFKPNQSEDVVQMYQRFAQGNSLLRNRGANPDEDAKEISFEDQSLLAAVNRGRWAWGCRFADLNNDGWQDLVVANGFITAEDSGDL